MAAVFEGGAANAYKQLCRRPLWDLGEQALPLGDSDTLRPHLADLFDAHGLPPALLTDCCTELRIRGPAQCRTVFVEQICNWHRDYLSLPARDGYILTWAVPHPTRIRRDGEPVDTHAGHVYLFHNLAFEHAGPDLSCDISARWFVRGYFTVAHE